MDRYGNFIKVRIVALSSLCRLGLHSNLEYIIDILEKEPDHRFKMKAFQVLATTPKGMSDNQYVSLFQTSNNLKLLEFLWNQLKFVQKILKNENSQFFKKFNWICISSIL